MSYQTKSGSVQTPEVLLAVAWMREETLIGTLEVCKGKRMGDQMTWSKSESGDVTNLRLDLE